MQLWGEFGLIHWLIVLAIILILFGGRHIPRLPGGNAPTHPLPVTSPLETSKPNRSHESPRGYSTKSRRDGRKWPPAEAVGTFWQTRGWVSF